MGKKKKKSEMIFIRPNKNVSQSSMLYQSVRCVRWNNATKKTYKPIKISISQLLDELVGYDNNI